MPTPSGITQSGRGRITGRAQGRVTSGEALCKSRGRCVDKKVGAAFAAAEMSDQRSVTCCSPEAQQLGSEGQGRPAFLTL